MGAGQIGVCEDRHQHMLRDPFTEGRTASEECIKGHLDIQKWTVDWGVALVAKARLT